MRKALAASLALLLVSVSLMPTAATAAMAHAQTCGGFVGLQCHPGAFCSFKPGQCGMFDMSGICEAKPRFCPQHTSPSLQVCGCNGQTYGNDCMRRQAGASLAHKGAC